MELLNKAQIVKKDGSSTTGLGSTPKIIMVYFSAHWCPPCRGFTPVLAEFYKEVKAAGKDLECIFVSSDQDEAGWKSYWESMPWVSVKFGDENVASLKLNYNVSGIPKLVVLNGATGAVISDNGRGDVTNSGPDAFDAWVAKC
jgi:nucleoredoxin